MPIQIDAARKGAIAQFLKEKVKEGATVCSGCRKGVPTRSACLGFGLFILSKDSKDTERCLFQSHKSRRSLVCNPTSRNVIIFVRKCM